VLGRIIAGFVSRRRCILDHRFLAKQDCVTKDEDEHEMNRGSRTNPVSKIVQGIIDKVMVFHAFLSLWPASVL
jgi:hypothetical protein